MTSNILCINGADETGKTTQISFLRESKEFSPLPTLSQYSPEWGSTDADGHVIGDRDWWFSPGNGMSFYQVMVSALQRRADHLARLPEEKIAILDRGHYMTLAGMVAVLRIKTGDDADAIRGNVYKSPAPVGETPERSILLQRAMPLAERVSITMRRTDIEPGTPFWGRYSLYQTLLNEEIDLLEQKGSFGHILDAGESILVTQNSIRQIANHAFGLSLPNLGDHITYAFGIVSAGGAGVDVCTDFLRRYYNIPQKHCCSSEHLQNASPKEAADFLFGRRILSDQTAYTEPGPTLIKIPNYQIASEFKKIMGDRMVLINFADEQGLVASSADATNPKVDFSFSMNVRRSYLEKVFSSSPKFTQGA